MDRYEFWAFSFNWAFIHIHVIVLPKRLVHYENQQQARVFLWFYCLNGSAYCEHAAYIVPFKMVWGNSILWPISYWNVQKKSIIIYYCIIPKIVTQSIRMLTTTLKFMNLNPAGTLKFVKFWKKIWANIVKFQNFKSVNVFWL